MFMYVIIKPNKNLYFPDVTVEEWVTIAVRDM